MYNFVYDHNTKIDNDFSRVLFIFVINTFLIVKIHIVSYAPPNYKYWIPERWAKYG